MRRIFKFKEAITIVLSIASSIFFISPKGIPFLPDKVDYTIYSAILNIIVLIIGILAFSTFYNEYYLIKRKHGDYDDSGISDLGNISIILKISIEKTKYFVERTSALVGQLVSNFSLFLWPLIIFYILNIIKDHMRLKGIPEFENYFSYSDLIEVIPEIDSKKIFWFLTISALANIFNFISAIGLWVCFSILYQKSLDAENKSTLHLGIYYFLLILYILSYIILLGTGIEIFTIKETILTLDLFCAIFNCVAMILFFNRLVQILFFYQAPLRDKLLDKFYFFVATIIFPLYACFQIFFAVFDQIQSEPYEKVKGTVFFVCFLGKLFLILFLYSFIRIKWLHAAVLTLLVYEETPIELARSLKSISNSIDSINDDINDISK